MAAQAPWIAFIRPLLSAANRCDSGADLELNRCERSAQPRKKTQRLVAINVPVFDQ
jgi:hypothetical protein